MEKRTAEEMRIDLEIGQRLLEERTRLGLSQVALSAHGGVTKFT